ncbi:hypothetical protein [Vibrio fluminensis]|uniref:hypothetical protein n=1 Tax=Vibrio fluminensis TaxID=2783614 RepID=UPI0018889E3C|nr:hypothetical protein [Vibrio fluminensis]
MRTAVEISQRQGGFDSLSLSPRGSAMNYEVKQAWKVVIPLAESEANYISSNKLFNCLTGNNFLRAIGGIEKLAFRPIVLQPTVAFHKALSKFREQLGFSGKKFPYKFTDNEVNINIHYYVEGYVVLTVSLKNAVPCEYDDIALLQNLTKQSNVNKLVLAAGGLIKSGKLKGFKSISSIKSYPCTIIYENNDQVCISEEQSVEILTRHSGANINIVKSVIEKNSEHQLNASRALVDRQGLLHIVPIYLNQDKETIRKFKSIANLLELSIVLSKSLNDENVFHNADYYREIGKLINNPELVIQHSVTAKNTFELLIKEFKLKILLATKMELTQPQNDPSLTKRENMTNIYNTNIHGGTVQNISNGGTNVTQFAEFNGKNDELFVKLIEDLRKVKDQLQEAEQVINLVGEMQQARGTDNYRVKYTSFMSILSNHMTVLGPIVGPYLDGLTKLLT